MKINIKNGLTLGVMALLTFGLKKFYQTASVHDLQWILAPTKAVVQGFTGLQLAMMPVWGISTKYISLLLPKAVLG
jgi:hypothetical protein